MPAPLWLSPRQLRATLPAWSRAKLPFWAALGGSQNTSGCRSHLTVLLSLGTHRARVWDGTTARFWSRFWSLHYLTQRLSPATEPKQPPERRESGGRAAWGGLGMRDPSRICCDAVPNISQPPAPTSNKCWASFKEQLPFALKLTPGCHTSPQGEVITCGFRGLQRGW